MPGNPSLLNAGCPDRQSVLEAVKQIVAEQVGIALEVIQETSRLDTDLDFDSLDKIDVVMELEEQFDISVPDEVADEVHTIRDIVDGVMRLLEPVS
jgi:acyl carrier protein